MKEKIKQHSGFSLIELIIAMAVLAFLMLAVTSFMSSSVMQNKKAKVDVRLQSQAQETYSLLTDSIMQATDIAIIGYVANNDSLIDFDAEGKEGTEVSGLVLTKKYIVRDQDAADALQAKYGVISADDILFFGDDALKGKKIYVSTLEIKSAVPLNMAYVAGANMTDPGEQTITVPGTADTVKVTCVKQGSELIYNINDTLTPTFYFEGNNMYYGKKYLFMTEENRKTLDGTKLDDPLTIGDATSMQEHMYNKYFSYVKGKCGATTVDVPGCVATIDGQAGAIGIDLYYNQSSMSYTTLGLVSPRNSYVMIPRK